MSKPNMDFVTILSLLPTLSSSTTKYKIINSYKNLANDIETESIKFSLICPLSKKRMQKPVR